jgi:hypothetical protein
VSEERYKFFGRELHFEYSAKVATVVNGLVVNWYYSCLINYNEELNPFPFSPPSILRL